MLLVALAVTNLVACGAKEETDSRNGRGERSESSSRRHNDKDEDEDEDDEEDEEIDIDIDEEDDEDKDEEKEKPKHTSSKSDYEKCAMMVYIVGSNLESAQGYATMDIDEMVNGEYDESTMDVYLCTGGASSWKRDDIDADEIAVYKIVDGDLDKLTVIDKELMSDPETLSSFIDVCYDDTDADCYNLILWNHGAGAMVGYGQDEHDLTRSILMPELKKALGDSQFIKDGNQFEMLGFDACLMGMMEVACTVSDYAHYFVASEEYTPGTGWNYESFGHITDSGDFNGDSMAKIIIDDFESYNTMLAFYKPEYLLSCVDLTMTDDLMKAFEDMIEDAMTEIDEGNYSDLARARSKTKGFGQINGEKFYDSIDLYDFADNFSAMYPDSTKKVKDCIDEMVVYSKTNINDAHGVAFYFPHDNKTFLEMWYLEYQLIDISDLYEDFIKEYAYILTGDTLTDWDIDDLIPAEVTDPALAQQGDFDGQYFIQLNAAQVKNYDTSKVMVWEKYPDIHDQYIMLVSNYSTELLDDGRLVCNFDDRIFYFKNAAGDEQKCTMYEVERNDDYIIYRGMVFVYPGDSSPMFSANVYVKVDDAHPNGEIINITKSENLTEDNLFAQTEVYEFQPGDRIESFIFTRSVKFNADGSVAPFDKWESNMMIFGDAITFDGEFNVEYKEEGKEENSYFCLFMVQDIQGNSYTSGAFIPEAKSRDGAYLSKENPKFSMKDYFDEATNTGVIYDFYKEQIATITLPDKYDYQSDMSDANNIVAYSKDGSDINITRLGYHHTDFLNGKLDSDDSDYEVEIKKKEKSGKFEIWTVVAKDSFGQDECFIIPYINCYGDQEYLRIDYNNSDMSKAEMVKEIGQMIKK